MNDTPLTLIIPPSFEADIKQAKQLAQEYGCRELYLFGSVERGEADCDSDIDLAVVGCPQQNYFKLWGALMWHLTHAVDLVDLDAETPFTTMLREQGGLLRLV